MIKNHLTIIPHKNIKNKICLNITKKQTILIGENGSGKSAILESIFKTYSYKKDVRIVGFSSGMNESFTYLFKHLTLENKKKIINQENSIINTFYFNSSWVFVLVFFATSLKENGLVREFLKKKRLVSESSVKYDLTTRLYFKLKIPKSYVGTIQRSLEKEKEKYDLKSIRRSFLNLFLERILKFNGYVNYDFQDSIPKEFVQIKASNIYDIFSKNIEEISSFFSIFKDSLIDFTDINLLFKDGVELNSLSDGEYQLLAIYAMIDLFDDNRTIFLFDEVDSHLHYKNISKIWECLDHIEGKCIATSHISETILNACLDCIKYVEKGVLHDTLKLKELNSRMINLANLKQDNEEVIVKYLKTKTNIVLIDNYIDWIIFKKLVAIKVPEGSSTIFDNIEVYEKSSSYQDNRDVFAKNKIEFIKKVLDKKDNKVTASAFLICDRDDLDGNTIDDDLSIKLSQEQKKDFNKYSKKPYILSWKAREIENYLVSKTMLKTNNKYKELESKFPSLKFENLKSIDDSEDLRIADIKDFIQPLYNDDNGFNEKILDKIINQIPKEEISEDIEKMYNFIKSKIES
ncbi:ABC transporter family protein [Francisella philomiragia subsp. philomiragia ATCC 25015]|uniref:ATP-binding protein n=1 Tax=Francisella philomiragia TaxID=28110 RepID=UPI0001AF7AC2|nr:ATP-binding protein [Francisella philomiragia]AJI74923.1 ABC transporter family protein [Francisella philomiragia subsp. philomiragia ATCC 25015]EET21285.1 predicted protein [Francisella philomiragia subsp. philomiragia ATCC 25015]MBK2237717.1 AAA family ATPase [Francisella philomiragia]